MSNHKIEVIQVHLEPHPNADTLSIVTVFGGYTCVVKTEEWSEGQLAAYIPPDYIYEGVRIRVKRLRGVVSMGLLIPYEGQNVGDDVMDELGITYYEPRSPGIPSTATQQCPGPDGMSIPIYDVENLRRYPHIIEEGELVGITEKIHGMNARFVYIHSAFHVGTHRTWIQQSKESIFWRALYADPALPMFLQDNPGLVVYGEIYGMMKDYHYGIHTGKLGLAVFDLLYRNTWISSLTAYAMSPQLPWVPSIATSVSYSFKSMEVLAEGASRMPGFTHRIQEGIVIRPLVERWDKEVGRVQFKLISNDYYMKKG